MKRTEIPKFGLLEDLKVVVCGTNVAGPSAGGFMADNGAEVILIERPWGPDPGRAYPAGSYQKKTKNMRSLVLEWPKPEGREALLKLLKDADIYIENSKGGQMVKWGLSDEVLFANNPKLVVAHVSGYGQKGDPKYVKRGAYDPCVQAFGGHMSYNGYAEPSPPMITNNYTADYMCANSVTWQCLAAYIKAQKTGIGESLDIAQYEVVFANQAWWEDYVNYGVEFKRNGSKTQVGAWGAYKCKDGYIFVATLGPTFFTKGLTFLGVDISKPEFKDKGIILVGAPGEAEIEDAINRYCNVRTIQEAEDELNNNGIIASSILNYEQQLHNSHYIARKSFIEYETMNGKKYLTSNMLPVCKNQGKIWRPAPYFGQDNEDVLAEIGYTPEQIKELYEKNICKKNDDPEQGFAPGK